MLVTCMATAGIEDSDDFLQYTLERFGSPACEADDMTHRTDKAHAYITHGERLLVFEHPEHPEAGIQVPGGTIEEGESPREAVEREAAEETGLESLEIVDKLGVYQFDMSEWRDEIQTRHVFWLACRDEPPEAWRGWERDYDPPIPFDFYWVGLGEVPELHAGHGELLDRLAGRLQSSERHGR